MHNATIRNRQAGRNLGALIAVGGSLAAMPATALELGEASVQSRLGQPLRASIAYALAPNESIGASCVSLVSGPATTGLPGIGRATLSVANGVISLVGETPVKEPMVGLRLTVNCPYSANLSREYMLFVDPPAYQAPRAAETRGAPVAATSPAAAQAAPAMSVRADAAPGNSRSASSRPAAARDIVAGERYQVRFGESLSEIAARIEDRRTSLWPAVNALFDANPDAFIDQDPNKLKAGAWLVIPASLGGAVAAAETAAVTTVTPVADTTIDTTADLEPALAPATAAVADVAAGADTAAAMDTVPADVPAAATTIVIPDTELEGPSTVARSPNVTTAVVTPKPAAAEATRWAWWLGGAGLLALLGLVLFGRRLRRSDTAPSGAAALAATPMRRSTDTERLEALPEDEAHYDLDDESPTEENLVLDADLVTGLGLGSGSQVEFHDAFDYAESGSVDVELPFEPIATDTGDATDILPPPRIDESSILEAEILPEDDDYDMSVIVDATRIPDAGEATERDLKAVEVAALDDTLATDEYTITREVDLQMLEQDYEDEMTATQALNEEIARAAAELAERMEAPADAPTAADETSETAVLPMASVTELDMTAEMAAANADEVVELDETALLSRDDAGGADTESTAEMPRKSRRRS